MNASTSSVILHPIKDIVCAEVSRYLQDVGIQDISKHMFSTGNSDHCTSQVQKSFHTKNGPGFSQLSFLSNTVCEKAFELLPFLKMFIKGYVLIFILYL